MQLRRGSLLNNRYRIVSTLGQGGMGAIYGAIDENLGIKVAVKENLFTTKEYARQFKREALILANLRFPNLPRVSDHFVIDGQGQYLVMDFIEGEDLRERMDRLGVIPEDEVIAIGIAISDALAYMHSQVPPVYHRDIKPGNVRITPDGKIFLVDFGLAKVAQSKRETSTGARAMTPGYSPPEQYGGARTDQRSDVFSLGATLYAALTGFIPEDSLARTMEQSSLTPVRKRNPKVSRKLAGVIEKALNVKPENRYQSIEQFKNELSDLSGTIQKRKGFNRSEFSPYDSRIKDRKMGIKEMMGGEEIFINKKNSGGGSDKDQIKKRTSRKSGCIVVSSFILVLVILFAYLTIVQDSTLKRRIFPDFMFNYQENQQAEILGLTTIETTPEGYEDSTNEVTHTIISTNTSTPTIIPSQTPSFTPEPIIVIEPTRTRIPSPSPSPTITPMGGGVGQIAFASNRSGKPQIWLVNIDGTKKKQITDMQEGACQPDWSPDGERLVFISPCHSNQEIYRGAGLFIVDADGTDLIPIPGVGGGDYDPAWSPNGDYIVFTSLRNGDRPQLYLYDFKANEVTKLTNKEFIRDFQPCWSPDGKMIAFVSTRRGPYQIWIMDKNGSNQERFSISKDKKDAFPSWSPDGSILIFTQSLMTSSIPELTGARVADNGIGEFPVYALSQVVPMRDADYSPDGFWIALEAWPRGDNHDIFIMTPNGAELTRITFDPAWDFDPAWRPSHP